MSQRYVGRVSTIRSGEQFGFIALTTITALDGGMHDLTTTKDIFVHQDDCRDPLRTGMALSFETAPDPKRGGDALRAVHAYFHAQELVLVGSEAGEGRAVSDPSQLYVSPTPTQRIMMKPIPLEQVAQVLRNQPMPRMPRTSARPENPAEWTRAIMARLFPQFASIGDEVGTDIADEKFDDVIRQAIVDHKALGMGPQAALMERRAKTFKGLRTILRTDEDLLRPESLIPTQYLPDLFMAVPVWYFWADEKTRREASEAKNNSDPQVHPILKSFCDMAPNQRWFDTFLMFNRRMRTLGDYEGDIIPPRIIARMKQMAPLFDHLVIMTPYHDVAGQDWQDLRWLRSIDPYVIGFLKGIPLMFVVGRFSDSGVFPLHSELVADTIAFLRQNIQKLNGFNTVPNPYWHIAPDSTHAPNSSSLQGLGTKLIANTRALLTAFDEGYLFDWLRGEDGQP